MYEIQNLEMNSDTIIMRVKSEMNKVHFVYTMKPL